MTRSGTRCSAPTGAPCIRRGSDSTARIWDLAGYRRLGRPFRTNAVNDTRRVLPARLRPQPRREHARGREARRQGGPDRRRDAAPDGRLRGLRRQGCARDRVLARREPAGCGRSRRRRRPLGRRVGQARGPAPERPPRPRAGQPPRRRGARLRPGRPARRGRRGGLRDGGRRRADLGSRRARADRPATAPAAAGQGAGLQPRRLAARDRVRRPQLAGGSAATTPTASRFATSAVARRSPRCPPTRSARSPSPPTAACSRAASSTATSSSGRRTAGGGWGRRWSPRGNSHRWPSRRTVARWPRPTTTARSRSGTSSRSSRSARRFRACPETRTTARFTPDGARLFALSDAGRAIRWEVDPELWLQQRVRARRRRPHARAVGGARPRAGLRLGLPLGLTTSTAARVDRAYTAHVPSLYRRVGACALSTGHRSSPHRRPRSEATTTGVRE